MHGLARRSKRYHETGDQGGVDRKPIEGRVGDVGDHHRKQSLQRELRVERIAESIRQKEPFLMRI
ncbi:hypothetical protein D3C87_1743420 [compost metagenome]